MTGDEFMKTALAAYEQAMVILKEGMPDNIEDVDKDDPDFGNVVFLGGWSSAVAVMMGHLVSFIQDAIQKPYSTEVNEVRWTLPRPSEN